jgi:hypothetical protein
MILFDVRVLELNFRKKKLMVVDLVVTDITSLFFSLHFTFFLFSFYFYCRSKTALFNIYIYIRESKNLNG